MNTSRNLRPNSFAPGVASGIFFSAALAGAYALGGGGSVTAQNDAPDGRVREASAATRDAATMQDAFASVARSAGPAVVTITTRVDGAAGSAANGPGAPRSPRRSPNLAPRRGPEGGGPRGGGLGSGLIYRSDGLILTNAHVVRGASTVRVRLQDDREFTARVLGSDAQTDVAVIKVNATDLPTVRLGDSAAVRAGDWAIAVGNPFGLANTLTVGVISATAREVPLSRRGATDYLQTDASINPGNSGGPLLDIYGRVIGINNAIYSESGGNQGIGFAIPSNTARAIAERLVRDGRISRGALGVSISDARERAAEVGLPENVRGVRIESIDPSSPAARAGLREGDIVQEFNGTPISRPGELQRLVGNVPANSTAKLQVLRGGRTISLAVQLQELTEAEGTSE
jgi:serine protease Do